MDGCHSVRHSFRRFRWIILNLWFVCVVARGHTLVWTGCSGRAEWRFLSNKPNQKIWRDYRWNGSERGQGATHLFSFYFLTSTPQRNRSLRDRIDRRELAFSFFFLTLFPPRAALSIHQEQTSERLVAFIICCGRLLLIYSRKGFPNTTQTHGHTQAPKKMNELDRKKKKRPLHVSRSLILLGIFSRKKKSYRLEQLNRTGVAQAPDDAPMFSPLLFFWCWFLFLKRSSRYWSYKLPRYGCSTESYVCIWSLSNGLVKWLCRLLKQWRRATTQSQIAKMVERKKWMAEQKKYLRLDRVRVVGDARLLPGLRVWGACWSTADSGRCCRSWLPTWEGAVGSGGGVGAAASVGGGGGGRL